MRFGAVIALLPAVVSAQAVFENLSPNGDGSVLYFSSRLGLKGTDYSPHEKIFVWEQGRGVRLYEERKLSAALSPQWTTYASLTAYHLLAATVSSDGETIALTALNVCSFGTPCAQSLPRYFVELRRPGAPPGNFSGTASLSPNGRFLLLGWPTMYPFRPPR